MKFFVDECKVMHRGQKSSRIIYEKIGSQLTIIAQEQDFEVMIISYHENMLLVDHVVNTSPPPPNVRNY